MQSIHNFYLSFLMFQEIMSFNQRNLKKNQMILSKNVFESIQIKKNINENIILLTHVYVQEFRDLLKP